MKHLAIIVAACLFSVLLFNSNGFAYTKYQKTYFFIEKHSGKKAAKKYTSLVVRKSEKYKIPALLVASVIIQESNFNPNVVTGSCVGLMQVNPGYWAKPRENMFRPEDNVEAGCRLLKRLKDRFGDWGQALTAYNFGENHKVTRNLGFSGYAGKVLNRVRAYEKNA